MNIIAAILLFGFIVFIHELGHFLFAKKAGVKVDEFAIGMGPKIYSTKRGETNYSIRILPIGGYVSMEGEDEDSNDPRSFGQKTILQRFSILFAGPAFNMILAVLLLIPVFLLNGVPSNSNEIGNIIDSSPAQSIGLQSGDKIVQINEVQINTFQDIIANLQDVKANESVALEVDRSGQILEFNVVPKLNEEGTPMIGISQSYDKGVITALTSSVTMSYEMLKQMLIFVGQLFTGNVPGGVGNAVSGPLGVMSLVSDAANQGIVSLLYVGSMISLNLGVLNLLPIPALDGGRILFTAIEALRGGKKINQELETKIHLAGLALLMTFTLFVTYKDILRLF